MNCGHLRNNFLNVTSVIRILEEQERILEILLFILHSLILWVRTTEGQRDDMMSLYEYR